MKRISFLVIMLTVTLCCSCRYINKDGFTVADPDEIVINIHNTCNSDIYGVRII